MELIQDTEKKMFLRKKGLTDDMIEEVFRKFMEKGQKGDGDTEN